MAKKNFVIWFEFLYDKHVVFKEIPTEEKVQSNLEMFANGNLTERGLEILLEGAGHQQVSTELASNYDQVVTEIQACRLIPNPNGLEKWEDDYFDQWNNGQDFDTYRINVESYEYDDSEYKAHVVYHMHAVHELFFIQLDNIKDFDPSKVVIRYGHEDGSDFLAYYDGEMLKFLAPGFGDDNVDYAEGTEFIKFES